MNPCLVAFGPVHLHNLSHVRGVPLGKPPAGQTGAVFCGLLKACKYLGAAAPSSSRGHRASSSLAGGPEARSPLAFAMGSVTGVVFHSLTDSFDPSRSLTSLQRWASGVVNCQWMEQ